MRISCLIILLVLSHLNPKPLFAQSEQLWETNDWVRILSLAEKQEYNTLKASFKSGDYSETVVHIELKVESENTVLLIMDGPGSAVIDVDPKTGREMSRDGRAIFYIKDTNKDGIPDLYRDTTSPHGDRFAYLGIQGSNFETTIYVLWNIGVAFTINKYLYNTERVFRE